MALLTKPSAAFSTSLIYITIGVLMGIWTTVSWYFYPPETAFGKFMLVGFLATGAALLIIGLLLGPIGRAARDAELPPPEVTNAVARTDQIASASPPPVIPMAPVPAPPGAVVPGSIPPGAAAPASPSAPPVPETPSYVVRPH